MVEGIAHPRKKSRILLARCLNKRNHLLAHFRRLVVLKLEDFLLWEQHKSSQKHKRQLSSKDETNESKQSVHAVSAVHDTKVASKHKSADKVSICTDQVVLEIIRGKACREARTHTHTHTHTHIAQALPWLSAAETKKYQPSSNKFDIRQTHSTRLAKT